MKKKILSKIAIIILVITLIFAGIILFSEKIHQIPLIENIKQMMNLRRK